jgi:hypothetical protein
MLDGKFSYLSTPQRGMGGKEGGQNAASKDRARNNRQNVEKERRGSDDWGVGGEMRKDRWRASVHYSLLHTANFTFNNGTILQTMTDSKILIMLTKKPLKRRALPAQIP